MVRVKRIPRKRPVPNNLFVRISRTLQHVCPQPLIEPRLAIGAAAGLSWIDHFMGLHVARLQKQIT